MKADRILGYESNPSNVNSNSDQPTTAVVVTIEGLGCNLVGAYGNALCPTPFLDRFAAHGLVADQFWMDGCEAERILISMWSGVHLIHRSRWSNPQSPIPVQRGIQSPGLFVSDSPQAVAIAQTMLDGDVLEATPPTENQTYFGALMEQSIERWITNLDSYPWLWIHSRGLSGPWDAPYAYRRSMCDEGDPDPPQGTTPPRFRVHKETDPDLIFGCSCGAGAQAMVIDEVWDWMETVLEQLDLAPSCLVVLAGILGYPLGEHGWVGRASHSEPIDAPKPQEGQVHDAGGARIHSNLIHTPLILRPGHALPLGTRFAPFLQPHHLAPLIDGWILRDGWSRSGPSPTQHAAPAVDIQHLVELSSLRRDTWPYEFRAAFAVGDDSCSLMVPSWAATWPSSSEQSGDCAELYAMPEDRWQQNEISTRAGDILEQMNRLRNVWLNDSRNSVSNLASVLSTMDAPLWRPQR